MMSAVAVRKSSASVSAAQIDDFRRKGFLAIEGVATEDDLRHLTQQFAGLYRRYPYFARRRRAHDLGCATDHPPQILEINQTVQLLPALKETAVFRRCRSLAEALLGKAVEYRFDHTIHKPPFNGAATAWHQDEAYSLERGLVTAHFWIPLHDVTVEMGCMHFIPGSHLQPLRPHRRRNGHVMEVTDVDASRAVACPLRAGDATVHFPRTLHYTGPNLTPIPRTAWALEFGPRRGVGFRLVAKARLICRKAREGRLLGR